MTWDEYCAAWSGLHGGFDPRRASPLVRGWVLLAYKIGFFLTEKRVKPIAVTLAGVILCLAVPLAALAGRPGYAAGALLVLLASMADGLDGAVAVISNRVTLTGFVYDSVADRIGEAAWLAAFWAIGAPGWLVVVAGALSWLHEYIRARATAAGMPDIGVVTVGERPARVSITVTALLLSALWPILIIPAVAVWILLQMIGLGQLTFAVRKALR
ncbi:CDP-alcohol phosphatidyltransferase family protein [Actinoplanes rectilineatus]|uniref:CDP-alcohol phosphatidyltransferase family protein n=1 Tax=Actinoplanes rectilineatus TaxID=113571 RepID=UPI0009F98A21|nr:CDP-alcohol phosphatidyltransferase family protein [Actinoplanes rectilineatus]